MKLTRLTLSGFKSFVERTELPIEPGLTGVVGPNGCGKSNVLEALRWVMGETSAKSMRGEAMDDVIFSGTANRPMRNVAEVILHIDNSDRSAPAAFNDSDTLEISRRIQRDQGSEYRVNGREVRARDVQLFFADLSSGAHSPAMVRQGQIGQLINAKPHQRRAILEEAAGIAGLHARRHEAELKLNAASANLARLNDVIQEIEGQLASLNRQARQAARYRSLSGLIREAEALALHLRWTDARAGVETAQAALAEAQAQVAELTGQVAHARTESLTLDEALPPLRMAEAERAAALQRLTTERMMLEADLARARDRVATLERDLSQLHGDRGRTQSQAEDASGQIQRLSAERDGLQARVPADEDALAALQTRAAESEAQVQAAERSQDERTSAFADARARKAAAERSWQEAQGRHQRLTRDWEQAVAELTRAEEALKGLPDVAAVLAQAQAAEEALGSAQTTLAALESQRQEAVQRERAAKQPLDQTERELQQLKAEAKALRDLLSVGAPSLWPPVVDLVNVTPGFEAALAAALGEDLDVPADSAAPAHWRDLPPLEMPPLPDGATPLSQIVTGPAALTRRLSQIGVVEPASGADLQTWLQPGQCLVTRAGDLWRWDGFVSAADAITPAAQRLKQRNRLTALEADCSQVESLTQDLRATWTALRADADALAHQENLSRSGLRQAEQALQAARGAALQAERARAQADARHAALSARRAELDHSLADAQGRLDAAQRDAEGLADLGPLEQALNQARSEAAASRSRLSEVRNARDTLQRDMRARAERLAQVSAEEPRWQERLAAAQSQIEALTARAAEASSSLAAAQDLPGQIKGKEHALLDAIAMAGAARREAADALAEAETRGKSQGSALRALEDQLAEVREKRAGADAALINVRTRLDDIAATAVEVMECAPEGLLSRSGVKDGAALPSQAQADQKVEKLKREREQLGGVNLRAEEEAQAAAERLETLTNERRDLDEAIARLRGAIGNLNREGRERLLEAFETVNAKFQALYQTLFQGGEARLTLTESEDPLEAGLDILARPPGKRLQSLSLLSGGEQALTALALIFAVFLVNPAPVCVLDEVDAPLDDANVERFCNLVTEITRQTGTRFLVITHHALSMSRMDRLVGVTMQERGVSRFISVDLDAYAAQASQQAAE